MSDIEQLEGRITAALDRIAKGLDGLAEQAVPDTSNPEAEAEIERLNRALEEERTVTSQLEERVKGVNEKLEQRTSDMERSLDEAKASIAALDAELQQLRDINDQLRESNAALRDANTEMMADPGLVNVSLQVELDALRAASSADRAEVGAVLSQLDAILGDSEQEESTDA